MFNLYILSFDAPLFLQKQLLEFCRIGRLEPHQLSRDRMVEAELEGVERQASDGVDFFQTVPSVTDDGVSQVLHVDTDLILAAGFQIQFDKGIAVGTLDGAIVGNGLLSAVVGGAGINV